MSALSSIVVTGDVSVLQPWLSEHGPTLTQNDWVTAMHQAVTRQMYGCFKALWMYGSSSKELQVSMDTIEHLERLVNDIVPRENSAHAQSQQLLHAVTMRQIRGEVRDSFANLFHYDEQGNLHADNGQPAAVSDNAQVWATHGCFTAVTLNGQRHEGTHDELQQLVSNTLREIRHKEELDKQSKLSHGKCGNARRR